MTRSRGAPIIIFPTGNYSSVSEAEYEDILTAGNVIATTPEIICEWLFNAKTTQIRVVEKDSGGVVTSDSTHNYTRPNTPPPSFVLGNYVYDYLGLGTVLGMLPVADMGSFSNDGGGVNNFQFPGFFIRNGEWFTSHQFTHSDITVSDSVFAYTYTGIGTTEYTNTITSRFYS